MNNISVDPLALRSVNSGLIESLHVRIDKSGYKTMMVPGKSLLGTGPFHSFKKYDLDLALTYIKTMGGSESMPEPTPPSSPVMEKGKKKVSFSSPSKEEVKIPTNATEAQIISERFMTRHIKRNGVMNILPRDSVTRWEFERPDPLLVARILLVAREIGEAKAVSRIAADLSMRIDGCNTLEDWWSSSSAYQRWKILTTRKVSGEQKEGPPSNVVRLLRVECPFKDTHIEVETLDSEDEENSFGGVSFASY